MNSPLSLSLNHISLNDMGTQGQTHTPSFSPRHLARINSHSSRAFSCLKLHRRIIDCVLPQRPQCGMKRIKTRAEKSGVRENARGRNRSRRADTEEVPAPGQNPSKQLFCRVVSLLCGMTGRFLGVVDYYLGGWTTFDETASWLNSTRLVVVWHAEKHPLGW